MRQRGFITVNMHGVRKAAAECTKETKRTNRIIFDREKKIHRSYQFSIDSIASEKIRRIDSNEYSRTAGT